MAGRIDKNDPTWKESSRVNTEIFCQIYGGKPTGGISNGIKPWDVVDDKKKLVYEVKALSWYSEDDKISIPDTGPGNYQEKIKDLKTEHKGYCAYVVVVTIDPTKSEAHIWFYPDVRQSLDLNGMKKGSDGEKVKINWGEE